MSDTTADYPQWSIDIEGVTPDDRVRPADVALLRDVVQRVVIELEAAGYRVDKALVSSELGAERLAHHHTGELTGP